MLYSPDLCCQKKRFLRKITSKSICLMVVLSLLGVTTVAKASTPAMASIEFFQDDILEATIDVVSELPGEQGNGLGIGFAESLSGLTFPAIDVLGVADTGFIVDINSAVSTIPYGDILEAINSIVEVSASFRSPIAADVYEPALQNPPPAVFLAGGADTVVPEPSAVILTAFACGVLASTRHRSV